LDCFVALTLDLAVTEFVGVLAAGFFLALLAGSAWLRANLVRQHGRLLRRVEALEVRLADGLHGEQRAAPIQEAAAGLPIGSPAPDFSLSGLHGETIPLAALRVAAKPVMLFFTDADCDPCDALLPVIGALQRDHSAKVLPSVISRGSPEAVLAKSAEHGLYNVLIDEDGSVARAYQVTSSPTTVIVNSDGTIGSLLAEGAEAVRAMTDRIMEAPILPSQQDSNSESAQDEPLPAPSDGRADDTGEAPASSGPSIGDPAPPIRLPDLRGKPKSLASLRGKSMLVVFWDPSCGFCKQLLGDLRTWESSRVNRVPRMLVVSTGTVVANRAMRFRSPVLLDSSFSAGAAFGAVGTPSAVLVDGDGRLASEVVAGAERVLALARGEPSLPQGPVAAPTSPELGATAPNVRLPDLNGDMVELSEFRDGNTLLLFWRPSCGFCRRMLEDLKAWEASPPDDAPSVVVVSSGTVEENIAMDLRSTVLLDQEFSTGTAFGADGTPMAVMIDASGRIASDLVSGASAVLGLANSGAHAR